MLYLSVIFSLPVVLALDMVTKDLVTPARELGEACGYDSCKSYMEGTLNVHIVPHTHGELGFTADFYSHFTGDFGDGHDRTQVNMKRILDYTITELWADSERKFTLSDMAYFFYWWKQRDGTVHRMVYELIRQGRLQFVGGGFSMSDESTTSYHAIIDMFTYSLAKLNHSFLDCGRPLVSWQSDVFGHSREFASLMAQMGFAAHFINPISYDDEVARMIAKALEFVWRGSDDLGPYTDIFTHKLFDGYWSPPGFCFGTFCKDPLIIEADSSFKNVEQRVKDFIDVAAHRQGPYYTTKNIMVMMGQRFGYFDAGVWFSNIDKLIRHVNEKSSTSGFPVNVFYSSPACYVNAVMKSNPQLATKQDDFLPFAYDQNSMAVGIYTARPTLKFMIRQAHVYLQISKQLQVTAGLTGTKKFDSSMERFKWINSIMQDHNIITGVLPEHSRNYYTQKLFFALQGSTYLDMAALNKLRNSFSDTEYFRCSFNISLCQNTDAQQYFIVIYNPLAWGVTVKVRLPTLKREFIVYHPSGKKVRAAIMRIADPVLRIYRHRTHAEHELVFIAEDIPPMGFRSYFIKLKTFGWIRDRRNEKDRNRKRGKRAILKKVNRRHKKKYLVRQAYQNGLTEEIPEDLGNFDYEYFEGPGRTTPKTRTMFGSFEKENDGGADKSSNDVITPRMRLRNEDRRKHANESAEAMKDYSELSDIINHASSEMNVSIANRNIVDYNDDIDVSFKTDDGRFRIDKPLSLENIDVMTVGNSVKNATEAATNGTTIDNLFIATKKSFKNNFFERNESVTYGPLKLDNNIEDKNDVMFKNYLNRSKFNEDDLQIIRKFFDKNKKKLEVKSVVTTDRNIMIEVTTDIFNEDDTKPETILNLNNISNNKKITDFAEDDIVANKIAMLGNKLRDKEYEEHEINKYTENNFTKNTKFGQDNEINDEFHEIVDNTTLNKQHWMYIPNENPVKIKKVHAPTVQFESTTNIMFTQDIMTLSDLRDSDFSDIKADHEEKGVRNQSRKFNSIFGSDDEQMKNQMFGSDAEIQKDTTGNAQVKIDKEKLDDEKWSFSKMWMDTDKKSQVLVTDDEKAKGYKTEKNISGESTEREKDGDSPWDIYDYIKSDHYYIQNRIDGAEVKNRKLPAYNDYKLLWNPKSRKVSKYVKICVDEQKRMTNITLSNGINITFQADMFYYASDDPKKFEREERSPGITMFRAMDPRAELINDTFKVNIYKNRVVQELHYEFASYSSFVVRLYSRDPVIELEWQVGPVPIADDIGKEIFMRYTTNMKNEGVFYTDSNGRQTIKRIRNRRFTYEPMNPDYLADNVYPVTSKIYIEDQKRNVRFSVFNDRSQGGTSLADGEIDLFIHRRILTDDTNRGILTLNETEYGKGIKVRGKHYIYLTKADYKPNRIFEKKRAKEIELAPQIFVTKAGPYGALSKQIWMKQRNEFSAIKTKVPIGLHILTLEKWGEDGNDLLLRLENYLEKSDVLLRGVKRVNLKSLFVNIRILSIKETSLAGNMWREQATEEKFEWKRNSFLKSFNDAYGVQGDNEIDKKKLKKSFVGPNLNEDILLVPQQIRTFYVKYEYIG